MHSSSHHGNIWDVILCLFTAPQAVLPNLRWHKVRIYGRPRVLRIALVLIEAM